MDAFRIIKSSASSLARGLDRFFDQLGKKTASQFRLPLIIVSSYLLLISPNSWLASNQTYAIVAFYLLANATLYFVAYRLFDSPYCYAPLSLLDAAVLILGLTLGGASTLEFYLACFCTLILACICNDPRGLLAITLLTPALYGYLVFTAGANGAASFYLPLALPFAISLLYGYFAQIERLRRLALEKEELAARQQEMTDELRLGRDHLHLLQDLRFALTSTSDLRRTLERFLEKALAHLPYSAAIIRLRNQATGTLEEGSIKGIRRPDPGLVTQFDRLTHKVMSHERPLIIRDLISDSQVDKPEFFREEGLLSFVGLPLSAGKEILGGLALFAREQVACSKEDADFLSAIAAQAAVAIWQSRLVQQVEQQTGALRDANRVKEEFVRVISHELRTPVNVISGYTKMFLERMLGEITPIQERALETMSRQAKDLNGLVNSVLHVSCIEAELLQPEVHETNFWEFLYELRSYYDYPLDTEVKLVWNFSSDLPTLMADRGKLRHILNHLINNAIKFTKRGTVTVSAQYLHGKKCMEFKVLDTGIGISKDDLPHIFDKFWQLDTSDDRTSGGVGLGLYIVKRCTDMLHGTIHVESKPGKGSTFTLRIPSYALKREEASHPLIAAVG